MVVAVTVACGREGMMAAVEVVPPLIPYNSGMSSFGTGETVVAI